MLIVFDSNLDILKKVKKKLCDLYYAEVVINTLQIIVYEKCWGSSLVLDVLAFYVKWVLLIIV